MIFLHPLKIKPRNPHNLPRTVTFPDWFLNEGRWYQSQQTMNTPILCCYRGDSPSQACSWLKGFHLFQKIVEVWKWRQRLEKFQRPQNVVLVIKAKRKSVGHGLRKGQKFLYERMKLLLPSPAVACIFVDTSTNKMWGYAGCALKQTCPLGRWGFLQLMTWYGNFPTQWWLLLDVLPTKRMTWEWGKEVWSDWRWCWDCHPQALLCWHL